MSLPENEKRKVSKLLMKIQSGVFDENDVDSLFLKMRAFSYGNRVFREVADFVAHNDVRSRGVTFDWLEAFYLSMRLFVEYSYKKQSLDISSDIPLWIKRLMIYQADKCKDTDLRSKFGLSSERLKSKIRSLFKEDAKNDTCRYKK